MSVAGGEFKARKRELTKRLLAERGLAVPAADAARIPPRPPGEHAPLSSAQQRMWFLHRLHPRSGAYNLAVAVRLIGELDTTALTDAFHEVVRRHDVLRTTYRSDQWGSPIQVVAPSGSAPVQVVDHSAEDAEDAAIRDRTVADAVSAFGAEPFDLTRDLPLRVRLLRFGPREHVLALVMHHIACDDHTWRVLLAEVAETYRARVAGRAPQLSQLPIQYADFAVWEQSELRNGRFSAQRDFWRARLSPPPPPLALKTERSRPAEPSDAGDSRSHRLSAAMTARVWELGRQEGCTPYMVLLAAFATVLYRYTGATDIAVGSPVVNRDRSDVRELVGNFGNTLVLRTDFGGLPAFRELLGRVRTTCTEGYAHQELPFDRLVDDLRLDRASGHNPLFDVMFSMRSEVFEGVSLPGVKAEEIGVSGRTARFDLSLQARDTGDGLMLTATHRTELFAAAAVDRMLGHIATLLEGALDDPDRPVSDLPLLTPLEERQILRDWNDTRRPDLIADVPLSRMVERQAAALPDAVAVVFGDQRLTYQELNRRANRLARHLQGLGVGRDTPVGVHLPRSAEMVVTLLAVLKAGGAFLPLEPVWPARRIAEIAETARPAAIVSRSDSRPGLPALDLPGSGVPVVDVAAEQALIDENDGDDLPVAADPGDLAYVIYTSGSTGRPKGVMVEHRAISSRLRWQTELFELDHRDAVLHKAPLGFDISLNEIFLPLVTGARLVVAEPGGEREPGHLLQLIERHQVTLVYVVPSLLDVLLERAELERCAKSLHHVLCGAETLTAELFDRYRERLGHTVMYHSYGPAETTISVTCQRYAGAQRRSRTTIGGPNPNTRVYVLDRHMNLLPVGVPGELYIGGTPLARGYLNEPRLTEERFVADPFGEGDRLYRSGDLGRFLPDGTIEFLGRADNQVKIRGFRIEPEEIEAKIGQHPGIKQAAVVAREDQPGAARLVAYCVESATADRVGEAELRTWLTSRLPGYLVPGDIVFIDDLPLLDSGKVDRKAVSKLPSRRIAPASDVVPNYGLERQIADVWCDVLGVDRVDVNDNFFDLGGNSLLVLKMQARLEKELDREITRVDLYTYTSVRKLARHLTTGDRPDAGEYAGKRAHEQAARRRMAAGRAAGGRRREGRRGGNSDAG